MGGVMPCWWLVVSIRRANSMNCSRRPELKGKCAIVTSYEPAVGCIRTETVGDDGETEAVEQYEIYMKMLGGKDPKAFEKEVKEKFIKQPEQMKLLIVVDKLLTGFDAPPATYLYIDKSMRDHGLFQAICRVNRLDGEDKEFGYIIDYKDLFRSLENAVADYTSEAFDCYDKEDVSGLLTDRLDKAKEQLEDSLEALRALCEPVAPPKDMVDYYHYSAVPTLKPLTWMNWKRICPSGNSFTICQRQLFALLVKYRANCKKSTTIPWNRSRRWREKSPTTSRCVTMCVWLVVTMWI